MAEPTNPNLATVWFAIKDLIPEGVEMTHLRLTDGERSLAVEPARDWFDKNGWVRKPDQDDTGVFEGHVSRTGGGEFTVSVARDTESYPVLHSRVIVQAIE